MHMGSMKDTVLLFKTQRRALMNFVYVKYAFVGR